MTCVRAPGSSANLGPGFDVLGAAIDRHAWVSDAGPMFDRPNHTIDACADDHLASIAYCSAGGRGPLWFAFDLRPSRGMGFSGAARAAAATLAGLQQGLTIDVARLRAFDVVAELEGHADNAAPSVFGGVHVVAGGRPHRLAAGLPGRCLLWVPDTESSTDASRSALPSQVPLVDAVSNAANTALLVAAMYESDAELFARAMDDRLHERQRLAALPDSANAARRARAAGAITTWLSGSGPSIGVLVDPSHESDVVAALAGHGAVIPVEIDLDGAVGVT